MAARLAHQLAERFLRVPEIVHKPLIRLGFLDRIEVAPLDVLDDCQLERLRIVELAHDRRNIVKLCPLRRAPATFPGDDLIAAPMGSHDDRLDEPTRTQRISQLFERRLIEVSARLIGIRQDIGDRQQPHGRIPDISRDRLLARNISEQRRQSAAQPALHFTHAASDIRGSRPITSRASAI